LYVPYIFMIMMIFCVLPAYSEELENNEVRGSYPRIRAKGKFWSLGLAEETTLPAEVSSRVGNCSLLNVTVPVSFHFDKSSGRSRAQCITMQQLLTGTVGYLTAWPYITEGFGDVQVSPTTLLPGFLTFSFQELMYILGLCAIM